MTETSRWGAQDEAGAYNLIDSDAVLRAVATVQEGRALSLAVPIKGGSRGPAVPSRAPAQHFMTRDGGDYPTCADERGGFGFSDDVIMLPTHGTTHIDALAHVWQNGRMYNGFTKADVNSRGASRCGIDKVGPIVTRALIVDFAEITGDRADGPIHLDALKEGVARCGVDPKPGDALLVRSGWMSAFKRGVSESLHSAGLHSDCADWLIESGFALIGADNVAVEFLPSGDPDCAVPLHIRLTRDNGIYLAELLDLDALAATGRKTCLLVISPLPIVGGVGSPINPVAVL